MQVKRYIDRRDHGACSSSVDNHDYLIEGVHGGKLDVLRCVHYAHYRLIVDEIT